VICHPCRHPHTASDCVDTAAGRTGTGRHCCCQHRTPPPADQHSDPVSRAVAVRPAGGVGAGVAPTGGSTAVTTPRTPRPTATVRGLDGRPLDRDTYARALAEQADPHTPREGDRVRITYGDGSTAEGRWEYLGDDVEDYGLVLDDGTLHTPRRRAVPLRTAELERLVRARAGCRGRDPEAFYPVQVCPVIDRYRAHAACAGCPVTALCRELALRIPAGAHGIWGATSERDRAALRRRRHADPRARTGGAVA
jgi:hypothetical protein